MKTGLCEKDVRSFLATMNLFPSLNWLQHAMVAHKALEDGMISKETKNEIVKTLCKLMIKEDKEIRNAKKNS